MITIDQYDNIVLSLASGQFTIDELESFARQLHTICDQQKTVYLISIPVGVTQFPTKASEIIKAFQTMRSSTKPVTRIYGIKYNPILSFLSSVATHIFRLKNQTIEAATEDDLFMIVEKDTVAFPDLKLSWDKHHEAIKSQITKYKQEIATQTS